MIKRIGPAIARIWAGHRVATIAVSVVAVVAIVAASLLIVVDPGGTARATATASPSPTATASPSPSPTASPTPLNSPSPTDNGSPTPMPSGWAYSDLDGVATTQDLAHRLPMAVMIADNIVSRPQSGISSASIVYQAYADGGEDRYLMIFQEGTASAIGPARSARPYYVYWATEYKALYAHVGGDLVSRTQTIPAMARSIYNMDDLNGGSCAYHRITERAAPQNDYTTSADLIRCAAKMGYPATYQNLPVRPFRDNVIASVRPASQTLSIAYRTVTVGYEYSPSRDSYLRTIDGSTEIDPANNAKVYANTIAIMYQAVGSDSVTEPGYNRPVVSNVGSGKATIFMEGQSIDATWKKTSNTALTRFYDSAGKEIPFVRGEIFMQSIPTGTAVTVK